MSAVSINTCHTIFYGRGGSVAVPDTMMVSPRTYRMLRRLWAEDKASQAPGFSDLNWRRQKREVRKAGDAAVKALPDPPSDVS